MNESSPKDGPLYPNQPLREVAFEVKFRGNLSVESRRAEFQENVRDIYPNLLVPQARTGIAPSLQHYRFENIEGTAGVQLAVNSFSFYMKKYLGAPQFKAEASRLFGIAEPLMQPINMTRAGWRYINTIPFIREDGRILLERYFSKNSVFGSCLNEDFEQLLFDVIVTNQNVNTHVILETTEYEPQPEVETLVLDIDAFIDDKDMLSVLCTNFSNLIDKVHGVARKTFENFISDSYRNYLRGDGR